MWSLGSESGELGVGGMASPVRHILLSKVLRTSHLTI